MARAGIAAARAGVAAAKAGVAAARVESVPERFRRPAANRRPAPEATEPTPMPDQRDPTLVHRTRPERPPEVVELAAFLEEQR